MSATQNNIVSSVQGAVFILQPAQDLQPESLGYHAYVDADKHYAIGPIRLRQDECTTVQPREDAPCILASFAEAHQIDI